MVLGLPPIAGTPPTAQYEKYSTRAPKEDNMGFFSKILEKLGIGHAAAAPTPAPTPTSDSSG